MSDETLTEMSLRQDRDDARRALDNAVTELDYEKRTSLSLREAYAEMKADYEAQLAASLTRERGLAKALRSAIAEFVLIDCPDPAPGYELTYEARAGLHKIAVAIARRMRDELVAALTTPGTPETPGLDAATVEACAKLVDHYVFLAEQEERKTGLLKDIAARIRSLTSTPSTPKTGEKS